MWWFCGNLSGFASLRDLMELRIRVKVNDIGFILALIELPSITQDVITIHIDPSSLLGTWFETAISTTKLHSSPPRGTISRRQTSIGSAKSPVAESSHEAQSTFLDATTDVGTLTVDVDPFRNIFNLGKRKGKSHWLCFTLNPDPHSRGIEAVNYSWRKKTCDCQE